MVRRLLIAFTVLTLTGAVFITASPVSAQQQPVVNHITDENMLMPDLAQDPATAIRATRELIAAGKMQIAIRRLEAYVLGHPTEIAPRRFLGDLYFRTSQLDQAKAQYQIILQALPGDKETHNRLGTVYAVENRVDDAIAQFNAALPGTDSVEDLVRLHERKGDLQKYREQMERAASDLPHDSEIQAELGQIYNAIHQPYSASVFFKRALDSDAGNLTAHNGLGLAFLNMHDYFDAIGQFKFCITQDPVAYQCVDNLAAAQLESRDLASAKTSLDRAFHLEPERAETFVNYGYLSDLQGDWQKAVNYYAQSISMFPYLQEAYIDLALAYEDHKMYPLAQAALVKGIASVPDDGRMHFLLGKAYDAQGNHKDALAQFKLASLGTDPEAARIAKLQYSESEAAAGKPQ
jgi:tetratricopeptide (TPR) repeat protein